MYRELEDLVHTRGSLLVFLPPYAPQLNPIEIGFSLLKRWIIRFASHAFREDPNRTLSVAFVECTKGSDTVGMNLYSHCGYEMQYLNREKFFQ